MDGVPAGQFSGAEESPSNSPADNNDQHIFFSVLSLFDHLDHGRLAAYFRCWLLL
jgi:hypothetical protein